MGRARAGREPEPTGVLLVDKPEGPTSHDVVQVARRALQTRRIGHTGTLDPFASGLLLLCVGPATRLAEYFAPLPKTYRAAMRLGESTDTDDLTGEVRARSNAWRELSAADLQRALQQQVGTIQQIPPLYSAKMTGGERMYAAARRGEEPERKAVPVTVYRIELLALHLPDVTFEVSCSTGTYIRAIARDVGHDLGVGAHLRSLRRTRIGDLAVEAALPAARLSEIEDWSRVLLPPLQALRHLPRARLRREDAEAVAHGRAVPAPTGLREAPAVALCSQDDHLLAIAEAAGGVLRPRKVLA
jgi:tRNA pseudouridine55 synthase